VFALMLNAAILKAIMLFHYDECLYSECHTSQCAHVECHLTECFMLNVL
jgi:hypothetical protein